MDGDPVNEAQLFDRYSRISRGGDFQALVRRIAKFMIMNGLNKGEWEECFRNVRILTPTEPTPMLIAGVGDELRIVAAGVDVSIGHCDPALKTGHFLIQTETQDMASAQRMKGGFWRVIPRGPFACERYNGDSPARPMILEKFGICADAPSIHEHSQLLVLHSAPLIVIVWEMPNA